MKDEENIMRFKYIDILKSICAFLVVCIHIPFPGIAGQYFTVLARIAVPLFFMITGYFYSNIIEKKSEIKNIKRIFKLFLQANLIYFLWDLFRAAINNSVPDFWGTFFSLKALIKFVFLNESPFGWHLWYLGSILYVLIIVYIADKAHCERLLYILTPILLLGDLVFGKYAIVLWDREFPYLIVRNFLFVGIPYFSIGRLIKDGFGQKINGRILAVLVLLFSFTSLLERFALVTLSLNAPRDHYISTTLLAVAVFLLTIKFCRRDMISHKINKRHWLADVMANIGRNYSTWIYILHPIFISCIRKALSKVGLYEIYSYIAPIAVYISTLLFLVVLNKAKNYVSVITRQKAKK